MAEGVDDAAAAPAGDVRQGRDLGGAADGLGIVAAAEDQIGVDEVAVTLDGNVADGVLPLRIVIGIGGDVQGYPLLVQRQPGPGAYSSPSR